MSPRVSVLVPAYNAGRLIAETLEGLLQQTLPAFELIVANDGSQDDTSAVAGRFADRGVRVLDLTHAGDGAALNAAAAAATGDILGVCDADDVWLPTFLATLVPHFDDPGVGFVHGAAQNTRDAPVLRDGAPIGDVRVGPLRGATLVRRSAFDEVGPWEEALRTQSAIDWWTRAMATRWSTVAVAELVMLRRVHDENMNRTRRAELDRELPAVLRAHLARKRAAGQ